MKPGTTRPASGICPYCRQRMLIRHGVRLSPRQADLFDIIERVSQAGGRISIEALVDIFYPAKPTCKAKATIKVTINHINGMLEQTGVIIKSQRPDGYRLERRVYNAACL